MPARRPKKPLGQTIGHMGRCQVSAAVWRVGNSRKVRVVQEGARHGKPQELVHTVGVTGSSPVSPTIENAAVSALSRAQVMDERGDLLAVAILRDLADLV